MCMVHGIPAMSKPECSKVSSGADRWHNACMSLPVRTHDRVVSTHRWPHPLDLALNSIIQTTCRASLT